MSLRYYRIFILLFLCPLLLASLCVFFQGCGLDINKDLLKPEGGGGDCIQQLPGNTSPLTAQDIGEISLDQSIDVCGVVEEVGGTLNLGVFFSVLMADSLPVGTVMEGTLEWKTQSSFVIDVWAYLLEGFPIPLPLSAGDYLEKTDATFRLLVNPGQELQFNIKGVSGEPGDFTFRITLVPPEER